MLVMVGAFCILPSQWPATWSRAAGAAKAAWSWYSGWISLQQQQAGSPACLLPTQWSMTQQKASLCMLKEEVGGSPDRRRY